ncbi:cell division protein FtsA [Treponema sp.]|uniref:cell division protein FtsA n=1 Tax=Treponema sp. TaxID=166 RepID=UPI003EFE6081
MRNILVRTIVGLDIGTCWIRTVIAEVNANNEIEIIGISKKPSQGVRNGVIVNIDATRNVIKEAVEAAEISAGTTVVEVYTSIGGSQVTSLSSTGVVGADPKGGNRDIEIRQEAKNRALECAKAVSIPLNEALLHILPQEYLVDGREYANPIGIKGVRLEVKTLLLKVSTSAYSNIKDCIMRAEYQLRRITLKTLAAAYATLREDERALGSILIDLGGGSTDVIVLNKDAPVFTTSIPAGGNRVTNDISTVLGVPFSVAEDLKIKYGTCWLNEGEENEEVIIPGVGGLPPELTDKSVLSEIISARVEEILVSARTEVIRKSKLSELRGTIVLTGGGALMPGIETLAQEVWKTSAVRIGCCADFGGSDDSYRNADFATAVGLVLANKNDDSSMATSRKISKKQKTDSKSNWFSNLLKKIN